MTLPSYTPPPNLTGISMNMVNVELGRPSTEQNSFDNPRFRGLQNDYSNPIDMYGQYGKSWPPPFTTYSTVGTTVISIPAGRRYMRVKMWGAGGGGAGGAQVGGGSGGSGAYVECEMDVTNLTGGTLSVVVGGGGGRGIGGGTGGAGGGGGGGGYTGIFSAALGGGALVVAGAGGGGGGAANNSGEYGGPGGGGGIVNGNGRTGYKGNSGAQTGGGGGTQTSGGVSDSANALAPGGLLYGGEGENRTGTSNTNAGGVGGSPGGGAAGFSANEGGGGGGGGAGLYGGAGGNRTTGIGGSGGGGGSSYVNGTYLLQPINYIQGNMGDYSATGTYRIERAAPQVSDPLVSGSGISPQVGLGGEGGASTNNGSVGGRGLVCIAFY